jgi:DNA transformation protein
MALHLPPASGYGVTGRVLCVKPFASMADESFKEFVLDQLRALPDVHARAMFGAHGLYQDDHFFGILDEGRLFFKTDAQSQADYMARGMGPFTYEMKGREMTMGYHEVPPDVLENAPELVAWARRAIAVAAHSGKSPKAFEPKRIRKPSRS